MIHVVTRYFTNKTKHRIKIPTGVDFHNFNWSTASEAVYDDYYKLKKRYEAENREKSDALTRVDQVGVINQLKT